MIDAIEKEVAPKNVIGFSANSADGTRLIKEVNNAEGEITIKGLSFAYPKSDHYLFKSLNLEFAPGEAVSLLGPSGCGKSSLLHLMAGLNFPSNAEIAVIDGVIVLELEP